MARSLTPVSLLDGDIPSDQHKARRAASDGSAQADGGEAQPDANAPGSPPPEESSPRRRDNRPRTKSPAKRSHGKGRTVEPREDGEDRAATLQGHPEHVALMLPPALWEAYDDLAFDLSEAAGARVSTSTLIKAVLLHRTPRDEEEAYRLAVDWLEARSAEDDPYGHEAPVQRNLLLYASQRGTLDRLARSLKRRRLAGARSKLICAVLHFRKPTDVSEARTLVVATRLAPHRAQPPGDPSQVAADGGRARAPGHAGPAETGGNARQRNRIHARARV